ncbi:DNA damage-inducible protein D [Burkholderia sp. Bp8963]|uniref:DNA damage-inducible protein D n=1 Tax=Burkholderia sp. Bp8963 TaxID=2184547 RepID=UPI000F5A95FD|nr:DNA damage-inducible protein D [Burkholderia sp. Bp8963]RQS68906.1 DNA damage-inducible protein D [Burkholderia sp. Bp8963]
MQNSKPIEALHHRTFESIKQLDDNSEFWFARDLAPLLDYPQWRNFLPVLDKAREACRQSGLQVEDHFADVRKMVGIGSGAQRSIDDVRLSRYACYLVVQNGDPSKPVIANGQTYFAMQTRRQELADDAQFAQLNEDGKRLAIRNELITHNKHLAAAAQQAGQYVIPAELRKVFDFPHSGVDASGRFELRDEHLTLLRAAVWWTVDANSIDDVLGEDDLWPMPMIDGKRPYGNSSYFQLDMADLLGEPYRHDLRGHAVDDPAKDARLEHLHQETLAALQVFLAHAEPAHAL